MGRLLFLTKMIKKDDAINWLQFGLIDLPVEIKRMKFGNDYNCTALIYEFKRPESSDAYLISPSPLRRLLI
jgi:hypothetical protein